MELVLEGEVRKKNLNSMYKTVMLKTASVNVMFCISLGVLEEIFGHSLSLWST
jgi:hypothetical protein